MVTVSSYKSFTRSYIHYKQHHSQYSLGFIFIWLNILLISISKLFYEILQNKNTELNFDKILHDTVDSIMNQTDSEEQ